MLYAIPPITTDDAAILDALALMRSELRSSLARPRRWQGTLRRQLKARAVRGSNSIEGIDVSNDEAFAIVGHEEQDVSVDKAWLAVKGYSDAMTYSRIVAQGAAPSLDESLLKALHFMVQGYDLTKHPGQFRAGDIHVLEEETDRTVYTGPDADLVPGLVAEFLASLAQYADAGVPAVLQGAMAHLNLVMIHPFGDGNGRMSRILQSFLLYRDEIEEAVFVSIEEYLGRNTHAYYDILAEVGRGLWRPQGDASPWIEFNLTAHYRQARTVQRRIWLLSRIAERVDELVDHHGVPERCAPVVETCFAGWRIQNATYRDIAGVSANVASRDLRLLVDAGILQNRGLKRGTWYMPADGEISHLRSLREASDDLFPAGLDPYRLLRRGEALPTGADVRMAG